jgi:hypothetical protein
MANVMDCDLQGCGVYFVHNSVMADKSLDERPQILFDRRLEADAIDVHFS